MSVVQVEFGGSSKKPIDPLTEAQKSEIMALAEMLEASVVPVEYHQNSFHIFQPSVPTSENGHRVVMTVSKTQPKGEPFHYSLSINGWGCFQHETINFEEIIRVTKAHLDRLTAPEDPKPQRFCGMELVKR